MAKKKSSRDKSIPTGRSTPVPTRPDRDRRVRQSERIARVLRTLSLIQSRGRWNLRSIAEELSVSERTVRRDFEVLEFAGVAWFKDAEHCYRLRSDFRFPTLSLTDEEAWGQVVATALSKTPGLTLGTGAVPTTRKLAAGSNPQMQQLISDAMKLVEVFSLQLADHSQHREVIKTVQLSLLQRKKLSAVYESPYEEASRKLVIHPYRLCLIKSAWYLVGRIDREASPKSFRVARFKTLRLLDEAADVPEDFDLKEFLGNAWAVYRGDKLYQIALRFPPEGARVVTETVWHHTQTVQLHRDGSATLRFEVDGLNEIVHWLLSWAGRVQVLEPAELKSLFVEKLQLAIEQHAP